MSYYIYLPKDNHMDFIFQRDQNMPLFIHGLKNISVNYPNYKTKKFWGWILISIRKKALPITKIESHMHVA